jgi:hypothetical protein
MLATKIDLKMLSDTFVIKEKAARRINQVVEDNELMDAIIFNMMVTMILKRVDMVRTGHGAEETFEMFLKPIGDDVVVNDAIDGIFVMRLDFQHLRKPSEVVPFNNDHMIISYLRESVDSPKPAVHQLVETKVSPLLQVSKPPRSNSPVNDQSAFSPRSVLHLPREDSNPSNTVRLHPLHTSLSSTSSSHKKYHEMPV